MRIREVEMENKGKTENDNLTFKLDTLRQQVNDIELKWHDKQEAFWQRMFMGCTGFVAVVTPLSIQVDMSRGVRWCLLGAVTTAALCALCHIPLLYSSVLWYRELLRHGRKLCKGLSTEFDFSPTSHERYERVCVLASFVTIALSLVCFIAAGVLSVV